MILLNTVHKEPDWYICSKRAFFLLVLIAGTATVDRLIRTNFIPLLLTYPYCQIDTPTNSRSNSSVSRKGRDDRHRTRRIDIARALVLPIPVRSCGALTETLPFQLPLTYHHTRGYNIVEHTFGNYLTRKPTDLRKIHIIHLKYELHKSPFFKISSNNSS